MTHQRSMVVVVLLMVGIVLAVMPPAAAQLNRGSVRGNVTDSQGAAVVGAAVTVANLDTGVKVSLLTNSVGAYFAPDLVPGDYSIAVSKAGFRPVAMTKVAVGAGGTVTQDVTLQVGSVEQKIEVTAAPPLVETTASNFSTALDSNLIQNTPLPGRDIQALVQLVPGITQSSGPSATLVGFNSQFGGMPDPLHLVGSAVSTNGSPGGAVAWYLDGNLNAAPGLENVVVDPSPDAVAEFSVVNNGLAAEYGRTSGAVVNVVLKSGTNKFHGEGYEFNRNSHFNASNPFDRRDASGNAFLEPRENFNNFGGTFGGPLRKDKTFFFASYDFSILHETKPVLLTVPTVAEKAGDFSQTPNLHQCGTFNGTTYNNCLYNPQTADATKQYARTAYPTLILPQPLDPVSMFYVQSLPDPNFIDPLSTCPGFCNNFLGSVVSAEHTQNVSLKIDHALSSRNQLFGEWLYSPNAYANLRYPWNGPTAQTQTGVLGAQPYDTRNGIVALGLTTTFTPTLINEARGMFVRQAQISYPNSESVVQNNEVLQHVGSLNLYLFSPFQVVPDINVGGVGTFGPQQWQNVIQGAQAGIIMDNVTKIAGRHALKGGLMYRHENVWYEGAWGENINFGGGLTASDGTPNAVGGNGLAQFELGAVDQGSGSGTFHGPWQTATNWGFYGQDDFRMTPTFTLNYGLRWDIFGWFKERYDDLANLSFGINPKINLPGRIDYMGTPRHPASTLYPARKTDFGPRLGFSWSPFGGNKTVVRGGFGLIYSNQLEFIFAGGGGAGNTAGFAQYIAYNGDFSSQTPAFMLQQGAPALNLPPLDSLKKSDEQFLGGGASGYPQASRDPYVEQWSLKIERQLPSDMMVSVGYVGTHGLHIYGDLFRNIDYTPTAVRQKLRNHIIDPVTVDPAIAAIYGCPNNQCKGNVVLRPYPQYQFVGYNSADDGFNRYHSMQVKFEKRYSHGFNVLGAYTFQKNIESPNIGGMVGNSTNATVLSRGIGRSAIVPGALAGGTGSTGGASAQDPDNRYLDTALAPDDITHVLNFAATWDLPFGSGKPLLSSGAAAKVFGGWQFAQNWNFQTGVPLVFSAPCGGITCRPNLVGDLSAGRGSKSRGQQELQWFNPNALTAVYGSDPALIQGLFNGSIDPNTVDAYWQLGTAGLRPPSGRAPGFWNVDMSLARDIQFSETRHLQLKAEVFNALNHQNLGIPNTNWCLPPNPDGSTDLVHLAGCSFGRITNVQTDPRNLEFGLKFFF